MDLSLSFSNVAWIILALGILVILMIFILRAYLKAKSESDLTGKYKEKKWKSPLQEFGKYPDVDAFSFSGPLVKFGAAIALASTLFAFSATSFSEKTYIPDDALVLDEEIEVEPPRTAEPPPPPPPPPAPEEEEVFMIVEQSPRFPGCEDISGSKEEKEACAQKKMLEYIYSNLKYPAIARENGIEGQVVIQFVVAKDGSIEDINVVRDLEGGCGEAALKVVQGMNNMPQKWTPGKQRGRAVKVKYTLPVRFKLEG